MIHIIKQIVIQNIFLLTISCIAMQAEDVQPDIKQLKNDPISLCTTLKGLKADGTSLVNLLPQDIITIIETKIQYSPLITEYDAFNNTYTDPQKKLEALSKFDTNPFICCQKTIDQLVKEGASLQARNKYGNTLLIYACNKGSLNFANLILKNNSEVNLTNNSGNTALATAALNGHFLLVTILLNHNATIDTKNNAGYTPLMQAARSLHTDIVRILLEHGANPHEKNNARRSVYDMPFFTFRNARVKNECTITTCNQCIETLKLLKRYKARGTQTGKVYLLTVKLKKAALEKKKKSQGKSIQPVST